MSATWFPGITPSHDMPLEIDTKVAHPARVYDYFLGGKNNFAADQAAAKAALAANPALRTAIRENRAMMRRMTAYLAGEAGIRQFLDIGTGLPSSPNLHEVAQERAPSARVVYVDNDPIVLAHARALLASSADGSCAYLEADLREPAAIMADPLLRATLDLTKPVAVVLVGILHFIVDSDQPHDVVARLVADLAPGSYLAVQHPTADFYAAGGGSAAAYRRAGIPFQYRTREEFARFFTGLELVPPGIVPMAEWRASGEPEPRPAPTEASAYAAVARKN